MYSPAKVVNNVMPTKQKQIFQLQGYHKNVSHKKNLLTYTQNAFPKFSLCYYNLTIYIC